MTYELLVIGTVDEGIDGSDEYILVRGPRGEEINLTEAQEQVMKTRYSECRRPGGYFCTSSTVMPKKYYSNEAIVIVHHAYDI